jgi:hypothetical protein
MIKIIEDDRLWLSIRFIEDEWFRLLKMNDSDYWRWMIQIFHIEDEWFWLLKMNDSNYWRWMIKIFHKMNDENKIMIHGNDGKSKLLIDGERLVSIHK